MQFKSVGQIFHALDDVSGINRLVAGESVRPVEVTMVDRRGVCDLPDETVWRFDHPSDSPEGICPGLLWALRPFLIAEAAGIPSGEGSGYLVSCPSKKGATWRVHAAG